VGSAGSVPSQSPVVPDTSHSSVEASQQAALIGTTEVAIPEAPPTVVAVADEMAAQPQPKKGLESTQPGGQFRFWSKFFSRRIFFKKNHPVI
jgi:hypothetical protein